MCAPIVIGALAASAALKAYGEGQAAEAQANVADANAKLADRAAADARSLGAAQAGKVREQGTAVASEAAAALAGGNIALDSGTARNLFATTASRSELDALTARNNAAKRAWGYEVEAEGQRTQAAMARRRSFLGPLGSLLGSAGGIASMKGLGGGAGGGD